MPRLLSSLTLTLTLALALAASAADWPQFLGPTRDSTSAEKAPAWGGGPTVAWKQPVGEAHSSPVVADGVVYAFFKLGNQDAEALAAFDAATGTKKWEKSYRRARFNPPFGAGPRSTPLVASGKVYTLGNTGILTRWDANTGDLDWQVDTLKEFGAKNLFFGVSMSPLLVGDAVVVTVGAKGAGVVAFGIADGKPVWQATDDPASYASPITVGAGDKQQVVVLTGSHLRGLSPAGKELWAVPFRGDVNGLIESSTTPVRAGDFLIGSSVTGGSIGLKLAGKTAEQVWKEPSLTCYFSTPVAVGPHVYMPTGVASLTKAPTVALRCVEAATGKVLWTREKVGKYHAALLRTAGDRMFLFDDTGGLVEFAADPAGYKELHRAKVSGETWAHPALSDGRVYVRDKDHLICLTFGGK